MSDQKKKRMSMLDSLAAAISEERGTIEDVIEPYLIQEGFILRTPRGRVASSSAYQHFGLKAPKNLQHNQAELEFLSDT